MKLPGVDAYRRGGFSRVPGWMHALDLDLFDQILAHQLDADIHGDLLEIGSYHGKSAIVLGYGLRPDETLVACDLFGLDVDGVPTEGCDAYEGLTVEHFGHQYCSWHERPPQICAIPSSLLDLTDQQFRFVHVDGGHAYTVVRDDLILAAAHSVPHGVIAVDDYRSSHTPGVSAAAWEAAAAGILFPFLLSEVKLYAATSLAGQLYWRDACRGFDLPREEHEIHGVEVVRMWRP